MKVIVCQIGSRHRYAVPRMLDEEGMLSGFFCDACAEHRFFWLAAGIVPGLKEKMRGRTVGIMRQKIRSYLLPNVLMSFLKTFHKPLRSGDFTLQSSLMTWQIMRSCLPEADVLVTFSRAHRDLARKLKQKKSIKNVVDVIISPLTESIMADEVRQHPLWNAGLPSMSPQQVEHEENYWRETFRTADLLLCPSQWVADGVLKLLPDAADKIRLVPYGCSIDYGEQCNQPTVGKVIFCGNDPIRKGLAYLAEAADLLKKSDPEIRIQVIGHFESKISQDPRCRSLEFLGKLNKQQMMEQYLTADLFVLPSLSEGFAAVVAEAVTAGLPCIVTAESGSGVVHDRDGLIVPARDGKAIADAIRALVHDRPRRDRLAKACLAQRQYYSMAAWKSRLIGTLKDLEKC